MADGFFTCGVAPIGAGPVVFDQVGIMNSRVDNLLSTTLNLAGELAAYKVSAVNFHIDPTPIRNYTLKEIEDDLEFDPVEFDDFGPIPTIGAATVTTPALPGDEPLQPPDAPYPVLPVAVNPYHPVFGTVPTPVFPVAPQYGDLTGGIPFPVLRDIVIPTAPNVDFGIPFTATPPQFTATPPDAADFNYTEQTYDPLLVSEIKTAIKSMLAGTTGLPLVVENALWQREAEREAANAAAVTRDAMDEFAAKGFTTPNGPLQAKLSKIRQNSQNQKNSLGRDVMIRIHEVLVDQFKFGVAQGIQLENIWMGLYNAIQSRRLEAAQVAVNISIQVYNALVAQYSAAAAVYKVEADVYATRIQAELAKLQAYSEQIKAQSLIGELNQQAVAIYTARLGAIETNTRVFLAEIQAYTSLVESEKLKLDTFRTTIDIEKTKLDAVQTEVQIWQGQIQGQGMIQTAYQTRAQVYLGNVQAWRTKYEAQIDRQKGEIAALEAETARFVARLQALTAASSYQVARGQAIISNNESKVQKLVADSTRVNAWNSALAEKIRTLNDANAQNTQIALKNGEINAQNGLAVAQLLEQAIQTATQVLAQMTSSFASSVNLNANVSDATSFSQACNYSTSQTLG